MKFWIRKWKWFHAF